MEKPSLGSTTSCRSSQVPTTPQKSRRSRTIGFFSGIAITSVQGRPATRAESAGCIARELRLCFRTMPDDRDRPAEQREREPVLVSACLLGRECCYDGRSTKDGVLERELAARGLEAVPFCPEEHGGLGTPRPPAWIEDSGAAAVVDGEARVLTESGLDVTGEFMIGAEGALALCRERGIRRAFLKERSPSCGVCQTHVAGRKVDGPGVTSELLARNAIEVSGVEGRRA